MTEVMARGQTHSDPSRDRTEYAGEIIEERRKDAEGRIGTYKYLKGKMLGKVGVVASVLSISDADGCVRVLVWKFSAICCKL
jgi:hypothetical protein